MGIWFSKALKKATSTLIVLSLLLVIILLSNPTVAETSSLELSSTDLAPSFIYLGASYTEDLNDIVMMQVQFNTDSFENITINSITIHRMGQSSDSDVTNIHLYEDVNNDLELNSQNDTLIATGTFSLGKSKLEVKRTVNANESLSVLIIIDISSSAQSGNSVGVDIPNKNYIELKEPAEIAFELQILSKNATIQLDTDGDLNPDSTDPDDDNDRYMDDLEIAAGSDPKDPNSLPEDTDSDYVPDKVDTDDDNDGVPDKYDDFPKDKSRQRDFNIVIIYAIIAAFFIIIMILIASSGREGISKNEIKKALEDENEFAIRNKERIKDLDEKILEEEDEDLLDED
jgi:hypothetical protein